MKYIKVFSTVAKTRRRPEVRPSEGSSPLGRREGGALEGDRFAEGVARQFVGYRKLFKR